MDGPLHVRQEADVLYKRAVPAMLCFEFAGGSLQEDWPSIPELFSRRQTSPSILCERLNMIEFLHFAWTRMKSEPKTLPTGALEFLQLRRFGVSTGAQCPETNLDVPLKDGWLIRSPQYSSLRLLCVENIEVSQSVRDAGVFVDINCFGVRGIPVYPSGVVNPGKFIVAQVFFFLSSNQAVQTREII